MTNPYTYRQCGTTGHEILDPQGLVIAWTVDAGSAALIVALLNWVSYSRPTPCH
jgi:hypothetical protein